MWLQALLRRLGLTPCGLEELYHSRPGMHRMPHCYDERLMRPKAVVLLLDSSPKSWGSKEEFHKRLAKRLKEAGYAVVLVLANPIDSALEDGFRAAGLRLLYFNYRTGAKLGFYRFISGLQKELDIRLLH